MGSRLSSMPPSGGQDRAGLGLLDALGMPCVLQDAEGRLHAVSPAAATLLGAALPELTLTASPDAIWDIVDADGAPLPRERLPGILAARTGVPVHDQLLGLSSVDGGRLWLLVSAAPAAPSPTGVAQAIVTFRDLSMLRARFGQAEAAMATEERLSRSVLRAMAEGVIIYDAQGRIRFHNAAAERILGIGRDQLLGYARIPQDWQLLRADGMPLGADDVPTVRTRRTGRPLTGELIGLQRSADDLRWVLVSTELVPEEPGTVVATLTDVTRERRALEALAASTERTEHVADAIPGVLYEHWGANGRSPDRFTFVRGRVELLGMTAHELVADAGRLHERMHPDDRERLRVSREQAALSGTPLLADFRLRMADGRWHWLRACSTVESTPYGLHSIGMLLDVTAEKQLEEAIRQAQRRETMVAMAAGVAHNFNNMLGVALPNIETARMSADAELEPMLADASHAVRRAAELVRQLLYVARGDTATASGPLDLESVVLEAVTLCTRTFESRIRFEVDVDGGGRAARGVAVHVQQVLLNLFLNARDAMEQTPAPCLRVALRVEPGAPERFVLVVADNGHGMDAETLRRLGEPFFTTKPPGKGTGLGFATIVETVQEMGGALHVDSAPGVGTTFTITVPVVDG